jgi:cyclase
VPCLLLREAGLMKTVRFGDEKYVGDPINAIRILNEKEVDELILLDTHATPAGLAPRFEIVEAVASECFMPLCYGGGIASVQQMEKLFWLGVEKVSVNTAAVSNPQLIREAANAFGSQSVVVAMDVKKTRFGGYKVHVARGTKNTGIDPVEHAKRMQDMGAGEILLHSVDRDGTGNGYDLDLVRSVSAAVGIPVVASGGAGSLDHFRQAVQAGAAAVSAGSFFVFHGKHRAVLITYPEPGALQQLLTGLPAAKAPSHSLVGGGQC